MKLTIKDAFGKEYTIDALSREEIEKKINSFTIFEIFQEAWTNYNESMADGTADINITNGRLCGGMYTTGSGDIEQHFVELYRVQQGSISNSEWYLIGDIIDEEEARIIHTMYEEVTEETIKEYGIDIDERFFNMIFSWAEGYIFSHEWWEGINEQLDSLYGGK